MDFNEVVMFLCQQIIAQKIFLKNYMIMHNAQKKFIIISFTWNILSSCLKKNQNKKRSWFFQIFGVMYLLLSLWLEITLSLAQLPNNNMQYQVWTNPIQSIWYVLSLIWFLFFLQLLKLGDSNYCDYYESTKLYW